MRVTMARARRMLCSMMMIMIEGAWVGLVMGEVYNVGDSAGWTTLSNSSYSTWSSTKTFRVGDTLLFQYNPANHNVIQVNLAGFRSCNITSPVKAYETGNDSFTIKAPGHYFFICSFPGHCNSGQKLDVRVLKVYHLTTTPSPPAAAAFAGAPMEATAMAPAPAANAAGDIKCLLWSIVDMFIICVAMWVS